MLRSAEKEEQWKSGGRPEGLPKRWSAWRTAEVELRLLRRGGHQRGEPGGWGYAARAGALAAGAPGRRPAKPKNRPSSSTTTNCWLLQRPGHTTPARIRDKLSKGRPDV